MTSTVGNWKSTNSASFASNFPPIQFSAEYNRLINALFLKPSYNLEEINEPNE